MTPPPQQDPELQEALEAFRRKKAEVAQAKAQADSAAQILKDLPGYLQTKLGMKREDVEMTVRNAVYGLYPDAPGVPIEFKLDVRDRAQAIAAAEAQTAQEQNAREQYQYMLGIAAREPVDAYPASADWYDGDHNRYARALERKALTLATEAQQKGIWVDLTPAGVQKALEADLHSKLTKVEQKRLAKAQAAKTKETPAVSPGTPAPAAPVTVSTTHDDAVEAETDRLLRKFLGH